MRLNSVKEKLERGRTVVGTFVFEFNSAGLSAIVESAGAEFILFDMEHSTWGIDTIRWLVATTRGLPLVPIVRVPTTAYHFVARALDVGALGVMVPMVESEEQARQIVQFAKYPPIGRRGAAFMMAHDDYRPGPMPEKVREANEQTMVIVQIETARGLDNVEEIAAVEGIDVLWVGQADLTNSLGIPGQFRHPDFLAALDRVAAAARQHDKAAGFLPTSVDEAVDVHGRGFRLLAYSGDIWLYHAALSSGLAEIRRAIAGD